MHQKHSCTRCESTAAYHRLYSGEWLCPGCLRDSITEKTRRTISKFEMLKHDDSIAVAVSGGKDSLSLLHVLNKIVPKHGSQLIAVTIDEGIDGYRSEALENAATMVRKLAIKHEVLSFKEIFGTTLDKALNGRLDKKIAACTICGILRRRVLDMAVERIGANTIATAHNLDDVLQTFLMNLFSGDIKRARLSAPSSNPSKFFKARRIKPFMEIPEAEIAYYAYIQEIPLQTRTCPYMGESIRSEARDILNNLELVHPGIKFNLLRSALEFSSDQARNKSTLNVCQRCGYPSSNTTCSLCRTLTYLNIPGTTAKY